MFKNSYIKFAVGQPLLHPSFLMVSPWPVHFLLNDDLETGLIMIGRLLAKSKYHKLTSVNMKNQ